MVYRGIKSIGVDVSKREFLRLVDDILKIITLTVTGKLNREELSVKPRSLFHGIVGPFNRPLYRMGIIVDETDKKELSTLMGKTYEKFLERFTEFGETICINDPKCEVCPLKKFCASYRNDIRKSLEPNTPTVVDLFCGAGGMSLGFSREGYKIILANDIDETSINTYSLNHPEVEEDRIIKGDIREVMVHITDMLRRKQPDIVIGGPPCQGFSMANRQRLIDDPRNVLYKDFVEVVKSLKPKFLIMENVKGMKKVAPQVIEDFQRIGYEADYRVLNARDFSVPQNRERIIYIGNRVGTENSELFDKLESEKHSTFLLRHALEFLRPLKASRERNSTEKDSTTSGSKIELNTNIGQSNAYLDIINEFTPQYLVFNHKARYNNDRDIEIFGRMKPGDRSDSDRIADIMPYKSREHIFKDKYYKLKMEEVSKTITAHMKFDCNMYIHPEQARGLTPREAARIQSFPDDFIFTGSFTRTYMQIGNSVPPILAREIARVIKEYV